MQLPVWSPTHPDCSSAFSPFRSAAQAVAFFWRWIADIAAMRLVSACLSRLGVARVCVCQHLISILPFQRDSLSDAHRNIFFIFQLYRSDSDSSTLPKKSPFVRNTLERRTLRYKQVTRKSLFWVLLLLLWFLTCGCV